MGMGIFGARKEEERGKKRKEKRPSAAVLSFLGNGNSSVRVTDKLGPTCLHFSCAG